MRILETILPGCHVLQAPASRDPRGSFTKVYHQLSWAEHGLARVWVEEFYSVSRVGTIRGMHLQLPPHDHDKLVFCSRGKVLDVVVDLRSGTGFGSSACVELSAKNHQMVFVPRGVAHGFLSLEEESTVFYLTTSCHAPESDGGVRWDSFGFVWPCRDPLVSARDASLPRLADFRSPFTDGPPPAASSAL